MHSTKQDEISERIIKVNQKYFFDFFSKIGNGLLPEFTSETTEMTPLYIQPPGSNSESTIRI